MVTRMKTETYTFVIVDALPIPAVLTARFAGDVGKPSPRAQAALYALELTIKHASRIAIYLDAVHISTIGRRP